MATQSSLGWTAETGLDVFPIEDILYVTEAAAGSRGLGMAAAFLSSVSGASVLFTGVLSRACFASQHTLAFAWMTLRQEASIHSTSLLGEVFLYQNGLSLGSA